MKKYQKILSKILLIIAIYSFILPSPAFAQHTIKIGGTGCALGAIKIISKDFEKAYPDIKVIVLPSIGSDGAIRAISSRAIDIGLCGRPLKENEKNLGLTVIEYAKTPFIFVANKDVSISDTDTSEIIKIYKGEKQHWFDGRRIRLILRPNEEADTLILRKISSEVNNAVDISKSSLGMQVALTDQENADKIESIPGAFGTFTLTQFIAEKRSGIKILSFNDVTPNTENLTNGSYNLSKQLSIVINKDSSVSVHKFINFMKTQQGKDILEDTGNLVILK
ncbi:MAG: substrate-binding domain-containing protein [Pseudomonadota bacterium]